MGVEHILFGLLAFWPFGLDHVVFLIALLILPLQLRQLIVLATTFTVAHTLTLALSVLDFVTLPALYVEAAIAFSIVYVAMKNLWELRKPSLVALQASVWYRRPSLTFLFGLMHGFGFSYMLKEIGLGDQVAAALLFFNLEVEIGQLLIIVPVYLLLYNILSGHFCPSSIDFRLSSRDIMADG